MMEVGSYMKVNREADRMAEEQGVVHYVIETEYGYQVVAELNGRKGVVAHYPDGNVQYFH